MFSLDVGKHAQHNNLMNNKCSIGNAILWAAAIIASALLHAPVVLSALILPALAVCSVVLVRPRSTDAEC